MDAVAMHRALNQALLEEMLRGRRFVLIVDEAQICRNLCWKRFACFPILRPTHSKLIQIVLAGQPQLAETLMRDSLVQLRQRIAVLSSLKSLSVTETAEYVDYRLRISGWRGEQIFTADALVQIAESSGGVPRSINNYCFGALLKAFHRGVREVDAELVKEVAGTLNLESLVRRPQSVATLQQSIGKTVAAVAEVVAVETVDIPNSVASEKVNAAPFIGPLPNPEIILAGNLTEKVRSQGWSKRHEYRILVTLERDPVSGLPIADRYYCCSIYVDEAQAAMLKPGKPVAYQDRAGLSSTGFSLWILTLVWARKCPDQSFFCVTAYQPLKYFPIIKSKTVYANIPGRFKYFSTSRRRCDTSTRDCGRGI